MTDSKATAKAPDFAARTAKLFEEAEELLNSFPDTTEDGISLVQQKRDIRVRLLGLPERPEIGLRNMFQTLTKLSS